MALPLPPSLSPSSMASFAECGLAFRYAAVERLPEAPSVWTAKGTLVHKALERLHGEVPAGSRTPEVAAELLRESAPIVLGDDEHSSLVLDDEEAFLADAEGLVRNAFLLEDPNRVQAVGLELKLEAHVPGGPLLRGVIDRLDLLPDGRLAVVDYKTGKAPHQHGERTRLAGVHVYALLVEATFGIRPAFVELLHLREPVAIRGVPDDRGLAQIRRRTTAMWDAVRLACETDRFEPHPSGLCSVCSFRDRCPVFAAPLEAALTIAGTHP